MPAKKIKKIKAPRAVGEAMLAASLARLVGVQPSDSLDKVRLDAIEKTGMKQLFGNQWLPYPWIVPVADSIMTDKPTPGLATDVLAAPDEMFLVKDLNNRPGLDLFLVWVGLKYPMKGLPFRGVVNHMNVCGDFERITAIQLKQCLR